jgi:hypothetical protein
MNKKTVSFAAAQMLKGTVINEVSKCTSAGIVANSSEEVPEWTMSFCGRII